MKNHPQVLLVEDNLQDAELTIRILKGITCASDFVHVHDGQQAIDFLFGNGAYKDRDVRAVPKVILLDLKLPKLGGIEVLRLLRADERTKSVPIVVLTSSREERDVIEAYQLGVNSYIVKPVEYEKFLKVVGNMLSYWLSINELPIMKP